MIRYSPRSAKALGFLKRPLNDVEVYVEDTGNRNMWVQLLKKLLPPGVRLSSVNLLGGRKRVLDACKLDQANDGRRKLYIIDGDFDAPRRKKKPRLKYLSRLRPYCVENLLLSEDALVSVGVESDPMLSSNGVRRALGFSAVVAEIDRLLRPLFILYASIIDVAPSVGTVSYSVYKCCTRVACGSYMPSADLVRARSREVLRMALKLTPKAQLRSAIARITANSGHISTMNLVSGKDYLFPIFEQILRNRFGYRGSAEQLKVRLASEVRPAAEPAFARAVAAL